MKHVRGAPYHPQTQSKIWHQTMKNHMLLENYYMSEDLEAQILSFVEYYNHHRNHESFGNVKPADAYFRWDNQIRQHRLMGSAKLISSRVIQAQCKPS
ncbi:hypothetical protein PsAD14_04199 [Pseudovibrio sp. Ad14]|nr:hypothetical protein PsAD14_04199 [Pseudovibrio sp. Ad14]